MNNELTPIQANEIAMMSARSELEYVLSELKERLKDQDPCHIGEERYKNLLSISTNGLMMCRENRHLHDEVSKLRMQVSRFLKEEAERLNNV